MQRIIFYLFLMVLPLGAWGQVETLGVNFPCSPNSQKEICDDVEEMDEDGDGFVNCQDLDCYLPEEGLRTPEKVKQRLRMSCDALTDEQLDFISNNVNYLKSNGIEGIDGAKEEAEAAVACLAAAIVSVALEYTIHWFVLNLEEGNDYDFFSTEGAKMIFEANQISLATNAGLACLETSGIPLKIFKVKPSKIQELITSAGFGFFSGVVAEGEKEYHLYSETNCTLIDVLIDKYDWGKILKSGLKDGIISVIVTGAGATLGPKIKEAFKKNPVDVETKIKGKFGDLGDDVWGGVKAAFLKFSDYPNIFNLSDEVKETLEGFDLPPEVLTQFDNALGIPDNFANFEDIVALFPMGSWKKFADNPNLLDNWTTLAKLKNCPARNSELCKYKELLTKVFGDDFDDSLIDELTADAVDNTNFYEDLADNPQLLIAFETLISNQEWRKNSEYLLKVLRYSDDGIEIVEEGGELIARTTSGVKIGKLDVDVTDGNALKVLGENSGRHFDPHLAGGSIIKKDWTNPSITSMGISDIQAHVSRFGPDEANDFMIDRLNKIVNGEIQPTDFDKRFYTHELEEFQRYKNIGYATGAPSNPDEAHTLWNNTHTASLETYSVNEEILPLYHPDAP